MIVRSYSDKEPSFGARVFIAENATIIGDVRIGDDSSIWYGTVLRGDVDQIRVGARTNIQDNCVVHVTGGKFVTTIADEVTIGHGAIVHGCTIDRGSLIGMGSRVLDGAVIGEQALVAAGALVAPGMIVPPRMLVAGVPARVKRALTGEELETLEQSWQHYVQYKDQYLRS
jgi:carbonic anhydrase/acetyltransferase-like protein (isoleucine patch superfamily)